MDLVEIVIPMEVAVSQVEIPMDVAVSEEEIPMEIGAAYYMSQYEEYDGPTEFTPSGEEQVIRTGERVLMEDITIHPIPQNYGLITYDGSVITVS